MHALVLLAVLAYAPASGRAGPKLGAVSQAVKRALRARGAEVKDGAIEAARAEHARGWVDKSALGFFAAARALDGDGRRALEHVELQKAEELFAQAEKIYTEKIAWPGAAELLGATSLERGVALFELGRGDDARRAFRRAAALDPGAALDETQVRPDVARAFADAVTGAARARAKLTVETDTAAELFVDGRSIGKAPAALEVGEGEHVVRARAAGRLPAVLLVEVAAGGLAARLDLAVDPVDAALGGLKARPGAPGVAALGREAAVDGVVAVAIGVDAGALTLIAERFDGAGCATGPVTETVGGGERESPARTVESARLDAAAAKLVAALELRRTRCPSAEDPALLVDAEFIRHPREAPAPPLPVKPKPLKFWEKPWLWLGLLAVSSVAVGLAIGLQPKGSTVDVTADPTKFVKSN